MIRFISNLLFKLGFLSLIGFSVGNRQVQASPSSISTPDFYAGQYLANRLAEKYGTAEKPEGEEAAETREGAENRLRRSSGRLVGLPLWGWGEPSQFWRQIGRKVNG